MIGRNDGDLEEVVARLRNRWLAYAAADFPIRGPTVDLPGLYSWWADDAGIEVLSRPLATPLPALIYAGQAGATSGRLGIERAATLGSRIRTNHLHGNINSSTFRKTLSAVLFTALGLEIDRPSRLTRRSNQRISVWIRAHLSVVVVPWSHRASLSRVEHHVLTALDPPLNLMGMPVTPIRARLAELRRELGGSPIAPIETT